MRIQVVRWASNEGAIALARAFEGTAQHIVCSMKAAVFPRRKDISVEAYLAHVVTTIANTTGVELSDEGSTLDERCESLVRTMLETGIAAQLPE